MLFIRCWEYPRARVDVHMNSSNCVLRCAANDLRSNAGHADEPGSITAPQTCSENPAIGSGVEGNGVENGVRLEGRRRWTTLSIEVRGEVGWS